MKTLTEAEALALGYRFCLRCGKAIKVSSSPGRPRLYCDNACKQFAYRQRHPRPRIVEMRRCACGAVYALNDGKGRPPGACPDCRKVR